MNATGTLSLQQAADQLGVHYMTAYRYVRLGMLPATREGRDWRIRQSDLAAFTAGKSQPAPRGSTDWANRFTNRVLAVDEAGAWKVIEAALTAGMTVTDTYSKILVPALERIGDAWRAGEINVAVEHAASRVARRVMDRLAPRLARRGVKRGTVLIGSTATELHSLPLAMVTDYLRAAQYDAIDLGAMLPADSFAAFADSIDDLILIGIGVTTPGQGREIAATIDALRKVTAVPIIIGGAGIDEKAAVRLGAAGWARTAEGAVRLVDELAADRAK